MLQIQLTEDLAGVIHYCLNNPHCKHICLIDVNRALIESTRKRASSDAAPGLIDKQGVYKKLLKNAENSPQGC